MVEEGWVEEGVEVMVVDVVEVGGEVGVVGGGVVEVVDVVVL